MLYCFIQNGNFLRNIIFHKKIFIVVGKQAGDRRTYAKWLSTYLQLVTSVVLPMCCPCTPDHHFFLQNRRWSVKPDITQGYYNKIIMAARTCRAVSKHSILNDRILEEKNVYFLNILQRCI